MTRTTLGTLSVLAGTLVACDGGANDRGLADVVALPAGGTGLKPAEIVVAPKADTLFALGAMASFGAVVVGQDQTALAGVAVSWASSEPGVFSVDRESGLVTALSEGTGLVQAFAGPATGEAQVVVLQVPVALGLDIAEAEIAVGDPLRLTARASDANGHPVLERTLTWSSSDPDVASVEDGLVTAIAPGRAAIQVTLGALTASATVTVTP
jgi:hypothetical protein